MEIALAPESASRIRAVLGDAVDLSPAAVPQALARLADAAPDVYSQILDDLSGSDIRLDSERALHRRHRRSALRRVLFGWGEYESDAGDRLLAKRRVAAAVPVALAAVMLAAAGLSALLNRPHRATPRPAPVRVQHPPRGAAHGEPGTVRQVSAREAPAWSAMAAVPSLPPVPALPVPPLVSGRQAGDGPPPPAIVFSRAPSASGATVQAADTAPRSPIVYTRDAAADAAASPPRTNVADNPRGAAAAVSRRPGDRLAARLLTGIVVAAGVPPVPVLAEGDDGSTWLGRAAFEADGRVHIAFQAAQPENAGPPGAPPAAGGAPAHATVPVNGVALDSDHLTEGVPGRVVTRRRAAAAAAIGAVAQAAADYMRALAFAGQITVADSAAQVTVGAPAPGWTYAASRLADVVNPQASETIETLEVPAGTRCVILITEAP